MERLLTRAVTMALVEGEITLPGGLREEARVLQAGAMPVVETVEPLQDKVSVSGKVAFHALYTQGDPARVQALEATADFACMLDIPGVQPRDLCRMTARTAHVDAAAAGGRLSMKAAVEVSGQALSHQPVEVLTGFGGEGLQQSVQELCVMRTVAQGHGETLLREELPLPEGLGIRETLYGTASGQVTEINGGMGRAGVSGNIRLEVLHASENPAKPVVITRHTLPFETSVELEGEDGQQLRGKVSIKDVAVASQESEEGGRILRAEVLLEVCAWADQQETMTILEDAYALDDDDIRLKTRQEVCRVGDHSVHAAESGKTMLMLPEGAPAVRQVLCCFAEPQITGRERIGGRFHVEGVLEVLLLYLTDDDPAPVTLKMEEPFRATFAAEAEEEDCITLCAGDVDANAITSDRVEMKYILRLEAEGVRVKPVKLVTDAECAAAAAADSGVILYFTQPGERLWDIARRYRVPVQDVKRMNPDLPDEPRPGQGVVVWRKAREAMR